MSLVTACQPRSYSTADNENEICRDIESTLLTVWALHKLAFSFKPPASILHAAQGGKFDARYMNMDSNSPDDCSCHVTLMELTPGFRVLKTIICCTVYRALTPRLDTRSTGVSESRAAIGRQTPVAPQAAPVTEKVEVSCTTKPCMCIASGCPHPLVRMLCVDCVVNYTVRKGVVMKYGVPVNCFGSYLAHMSMCMLLASVIFFVTRHQLAILPALFVLAW